MANASARADDRLRRAGGLARCIGVCALGALGARPAHTQAAGQIVTDQSVVIQRFAAPREPGTIALDVPDAPPRLPPEKARDLRFTLRSLTVEGAGAYPATPLAPAWQESLGATISLDDLNGIAARIEREIARAGYFSQAVVPDQDFASGRIVIRLYESYLGEVAIRTDKPRLRQRLAPYVAQLVAMHPIRIKDAERVLLLMSDLAGIAINGTITRPATPGGGGSLKLELGFTRATGGIAFDNWGTDRIGPLQLAATASVNDVFGLFDATQLVGLTVPDTPEKLLFAQIGQDVPVGTHGVHVGYRLNHVASRPGADLRRLDVTVAATSGTAFVSYPFLRTIARSLFGRVELNLRQNAVDIGGDATSRDRNRWLVGSLRYIAAAGGRSTSVVGAVGQGVGILGESAGADTRVTRFGVPVGYRFGKIDLDLSRPLLARTTIAFRASGQYAPDALPTAVQFNLGGDLYGRAFDGQTASGDSGVAAYLAVSRTVAFGAPFLTNASLYWFGDYGTVWNHSTGVDYAQATLGSTGIGARGRIADAVDAHLIAAVPWIDTGALSNLGVRVLFRLAARF